MIRLAGRIALALAVALGGLDLAARADAAPVLYGAAHSGSDGLSTFYSLDATTGAATAIGAIGFERVSGMDFHPTTGVLYATAERSDGSDVPVLITIDLATGAGTEVATLNGGTPHSFGDAYADISFRSDGALYAYLEPSDGLGTLDVGTGALTELGFTGVGGCCGNGIAFSGSDVLLHANEVELSELNQSTAVASYLATLGFPAGQVFPRVTALDFDPATGTLYAAVRRDFANYLATIDPLTGAVSSIGASVNGLDALAVFSVPEPGTLALLAVAALGRLLRRQSSAA
jgi:DNA-binding beta-propeller fold protein YncE